jgi:hypothetical protein
MTLRRVEKKENSIMTVGLTAITTKCSFEHLGRPFHSAAWWDWQYS